MSLKKELKSTVVDWMQHIPLGFRFCPTDLEAFAYLFSKMYLKKSLNCLRLEFVEEFDVYEFEPCRLPRKDGDEFAYYFTPRCHLSKSKISRYTRDGIGYWRISGTTSKTKAGKKNTLVYYIKSKDERGKGDKTNWIMHEYVLISGGGGDGARSLSRRSRTVVLCRIYERKEHEETGIQDFSTEGQPGFDNGLDLPGLMRMVRGESAFREGNLFCDVDNNASISHSPADENVDSIVGPNSRVNNTRRGNLFSNNNATFSNSPADTDDRVDSSVDLDFRVNTQQYYSTRDLIQIIDRPFDLPKKRILEEEDIDIDLSLRL